MARKGIGIDIGGDAIRVVAGSDKKGTFTVEKLLVVPLGRDDQDPARRGAVLKRALAAAGVKGEVSAGLTGRDVVIRYTQVPPVPEWQLRQLMGFEIQEMTGQSGEELAADFNLLPAAGDLTDNDTVLLALAKQGILDSHARVLAAAGLAVRSFVPNAIALYNAYRRVGAGEGTTLLVNIGGRNTDMAIVRDGDLIFARNVSGGGELFDDALAATFNVSQEKARRLKEEMADVSPFDSATRRSPQEEKVARALAGATGQLFSLVQSSVMFARSQTGIADLNLDRVLLSGGCALLKGLDRYLQANLGIPVERFAPFDALDATQVEEELDESARTTAVVALGLAAAAAAEDLYSIEILPPALKKARAFKERTLFAALAAVLAILYLGFDAYRTRAEYTQVVQDEGNLRREADRRGKRAAQYEAAVARRAEQVMRLAQLQERAVSGAGLDRALSLVQRHLPADLYVTSIAVRRVKDPELGIEGEAQPVVEVKGEGKEGAESLDQLFNRFAQDLAADPQLERTPKTRTSPGGARKAFEWSVLMNFAKAAAAGGDAGADAAANGEEP